MSVGPEKQQFETENLVPVAAKNILSYGMGKFVGLYVFIFIHPTQGCESINFHDNTSER